MDTIQKGKSRKISLRKKAILASTTAILALSLGATSLFLPSGAADSPAELADTAYSVSYSLNGKADYVVLKNSGIYEWSKAATKGWRNASYTTSGEDRINVSAIIAKDKGVTDNPVTLYVRGAGDDVTAASTTVEKLTLTSRNAAPTYLAKIPVVVEANAPGVPELGIPAGSKIGDITADVIYSPFNNTFYLKIDADYRYVFLNAEGDVVAQAESTSATATGSPVTGYSPWPFGTSTNNSFEQAETLQVGKYKTDGTEAVSQFKKIAYAPKAVAPKASFNYVANTFKGTTAKQEYALYNSVDNDGDDSNGENPGYEANANGIIWTAFTASNQGLADVLGSKGNITKVAVRTAATTAKRASAATVIEVSSDVTAAPDVTYDAATEKFTLANAVANRTIEYRVNKFIVNKTGDPAEVKWSAWSAVTFTENELDANAKKLVPAAGTKTAVAKGQTAVAVEEWQYEFRYKGANADAKAQKDAEQASGVKPASIKPRAAIAKTDFTFDGTTNEVKYTGQENTTFQVKVGDSVVGPLDKTTPLAITLSTTAKTKVIFYVEQGANNSKSVEVALEVAKQPAALAAPVLTLDTDKEVISGLKKGTVYNVEWVVYTGDVASIDWSAATVQRNDYTATATTATALSNDLKVLGLGNAVSNDDKVAIRFAVKAADGTAGKEGTAGKPSPVPSVFSNVLEIVAPTV
ncbi:hypothetical protein FACS1894132_02550 [Clostridia bacterium]|nr:hypothetical protein FACS1894132_02550 [Clostridia bacterium]